MKLNLPFIDRIWRVRSTLVLDEALAPSEAFDRLDPLFDTPGTQYSVDGDTLSYTKSNPNPQDKLATFTRGTITVVPGQGSVTLAYDVKSHALLLAFLAPLLFLSFAGLALGLNALDPPDPKTEAELAEEEAEKAEDPARLHWIDKALGAPAPEKPDDTEDADGAEDGDGDGDGDGEGDGEGDKPKEKHSPKSAYVLAGLFLIIFAVGRILEPFLFKRTLRNALTGTTQFIAGDPGEDNQAADRAASQIKKPGEGETNLTT